MQGRLHGENSEAATAAAAVLAMMERDVEF